MQQQLTSPEGRRLWPDALLHEVTKTAKSVVFGQQHKEAGENDDDDEQQPSYPVMKKQRIS